MYAQPFVGHEAIMSRKNAGFVSMPDLQITVTKRIVRGDQLTVEWVASGTHQADYPGLPATGRSFSIPASPLLCGRMARSCANHSTTIWPRYNDSSGPGDLRGNRSFPPADPYLPTPLLVGRVRARQCPAFSIHSRGKLREINFPLSLSFPLYQPPLSFRVHLPSAPSRWPPPR